MAQVFVLPNNLYEVYSVYLYVIENAA